MMLQIISQEASQAVDQVRGFICVCIGWRVRWCVCIYIYVCVYIYICVCVCVCVYDKERESVEGVGCV